MPKKFDRDEFLFDLYAMSSTEVQKMFLEELQKSNPDSDKLEAIVESGLVDTTIYTVIDQYPSDDEPLVFGTFDDVRDFAIYHYKDCPRDYDPDGVFSVRQLKADDDAVVEFLENFFGAYVVTYEVVGGILRKYDIE